LSHVLGGGQIVPRPLVRTKVRVFPKLGGSRWRFRGYINIYIQSGPKHATLLFVSDTSPPNVVFEGDSRDIIRSFPKDIRSDLGTDLDRVQNGEKPLDSAPMSPILPGVFELRGDDQSFWLSGAVQADRGWVYVLHCFKKKTNKTSLNDIKIARERLTRLKERLAEQKRKKN